MDTLPADYAERVYAGVLGKVIGVYLGRPFEGWTNEMIESQLGDIEYYVHEEVSRIHAERTGRADFRLPLIVTDDDISGTFTFVRSMTDNGFDPGLSAKAIGKSWLNYLIEERTVLWWGGLGNSTEHTAYLRLKNGIDAPDSGSIATNGQVVAEQIGGQIFIDGWSMLFPGEPDKAADMARRAASVSHDGAGVEGAVVIAAMEAQAFVESDVDKLIDTALTFVDPDGVIHRMIHDVREWHAANPTDWRATFKQIQGRYGYDKYGGNCHMVPNHGLIVMSLLHSDGDFSKAQTIVNTAGWDTDCNAGNVGCLMGILTGIDGIDNSPVDWRGPVADRLYLPTADGGRAISDAVREADHIIKAGRMVHGQDAIDPKDGARFHFSYPGAVQGFTSGDAVLRNEPNADGVRELVIAAPAGTATATTATFVESLETAKFFEKAGYALMASPTLGSGQTVRAKVRASDRNESEISASLVVRVFDADDQLETLTGPTGVLAPGAGTDLEFTVPDTNGRPVAFVGVQTESAAPAELCLDRLTWDGVPTVSLGRHSGGEMWSRAWVNGIDHSAKGWSESFRLVQNAGTGLVIYGCREWQDYQVSADVTPHLVKRAGVSARVQGMRRHYSMVLVPGAGVEILATVDAPEVLATVPCDVELGTTWKLTLVVEGSTIRGSATSPHGETFEIEAIDDRLTEGAIALLCEEGRTATSRVELQPLG